jgi:hypothetical protein
MPDSTVPLLAFSDFRYLRNSRWRTVNWKNTGSLEWTDISAKSQRQTPHFRLGPTSWWQCRHRPTSRTPQKFPFKSYFHLRFPLRVFIDISSSGYRPMSGSIGSDISKSGVVDNIGVAVGIASPALSVQKLFPLPVSTSGFHRHFQFRI